MDVDLVIRAGLIVDGTGGEPYEGDVAVKDGRIVEIARNFVGRGREEIDAKGRIVTPGFIDIHTHYDGQVTWDERLWPSSFHGVTTVLMGNCGVGFAPCRAEDQVKLVRLMEGVEDLPEVVLAEGLPWTWETFPEYLDFLGKRAYDMDVATQVPHSAIRIYVMGERASERADATPEERAAMAAIAREAIEAGALGFGTSRTINHRSSDGTLVPTLDAAEAELTEIGRALGDAGLGVLQVSDFQDVDDELPRLRRIVEGAGRPLSLSVLLRANGQWRSILEWVEQCIAAGLEVRAQVAGRPIGVLQGFELTFNPFSGSPTFKDLKTLSPAERLAALRRPDVRARIISEAARHGRNPGDPPVYNWEGMYPIGEYVNYEPGPDESIAGGAARLGVAPEEFAYDVMLAHDGKGMLLIPASGLVDGSLDTVGDVMRRPYTIPALGDGGAHVGILCDASYPTFMLEYWGRERQKGSGPVPVAELVRRLTHDPASAVGLCDRGLLRAGYRADINVIDLDNLRLGPPRMEQDLPAGGSRLLQRASGYTATVVNGQVTYRDGAATGALPGRLVRGAQPAPAIG